MAKINNIIRLLDYKDATELYSQIDRDLETCGVNHCIYKCIMFFTSWGQWMGFIPSWIEVYRKVEM